MRGGFLAARTKLLHTVLARGVARGEMRADVDRSVAMDVLRGPQLMRLASGDPWEPREALHVHGPARLSIRVGRRPVAVTTP